MMSDRRQFGYEQTHYKRYRKGNRRERPPPHLGEILAGR